MALTLILFLGSAVAIYVACEFFVNGVEWVGERLAIGQTATGTILAAFGTALPESVVTLVAVIFGKSADEKNIGVGAALGGPLVLATLAYSVVGLTLLGCRMSSRRGSRALDADTSRLSRDQGWFIGIFVFKIGLGLVAFAGKSWLGLLFIAAYGLYVMKELRAPVEIGETVELEPLRIRPNAIQPSLAWAALQTGAALAVIFVASRIFVGQFGALGEWFGVAPQPLALLLSPVATEMPETMNAIIWVRQGKERLALANISGAMMIQATIPSALGLLFTPWLLQNALILAAGVTLIAVAALFVMFRGGRITAVGLAWIGVLYPVFALLWIFS